jgi:hypothetical protein
VARDRRWGRGRGRTRPEMGWAVAWTYLDPMLLLFLVRRDMGNEGHDGGRPSSGCTAARRAPLRNLLLIPISHLSLQGHGQPIADCMPRISVVAAADPFPRADRDGPVSPMSMAGGGVTGAVVSTRRRRRRVPPRRRWTLPRWRWTPSPSETRQVDINSACPNVVGQAGGGSTGFQTEPGRR